MERITRKNLDHAVDTLNRVAGTAPAPYTRHEDGKHTANIGNYHLSGSYGGWSLHQMLNEGGGIRDVFECGHVPARELYGRIHAFMAGMRESK